MATANNIAFWEILNHGVHNSRLKILLDRLTFPGVGLKHASPILLSCFLSFVLVPICFLAFFRPHKEDHNHTRATLRALLTIVAPTCSFWPSRYIKLASVRRSRVEIPMEAIVEDTTSGIIEFCDPVNDLADLIGPGTTVNGHTIRIKVAWRWWIDYFWWRMFARGTSVGQLNSGRLDQLHGNLSAPSPRVLSSNLFASISSTPDPLLCLDSLPHGTVPFLNAGCKATLEFTAFSPSLRMLSTAQIISAIPFIISDRSRRRPRSLASVLKQLNASYGPDLVVDTISNVSNGYEHALRHVYKSTSADRRIRESGGKNPGIETWRRNMFLLALEATLVRLGWIERWVVQVTAK